MEPRGFVQSSTDTRSAYLCSLPHVLNPLLDIDDFPVTLAGAKFCRDRDRGRMARFMYIMCIMYIMLMQVVLFKLHQWHLFIQ